jgi:hypothetical protein
MRSLKTNGLVPAPDFPVEPYEAVHDVVVARWGNQELYEDFAAAWNAVSYRFEAAAKSGTEFEDSLRIAGATPTPDERFRQDSALAEFFSGGYSVFESVFYGLHAVGSCLDPSLFSLATPKARQQVSPSHTTAAFKKGFAGDPFITVLDAFAADPAYLEWKEIRNVLTHRTAPGRRMYMGIGGDGAPPTEWKLNDIPMDTTLVSTRRAALTRLLGHLMDGAAAFLQSRT